VKPPDYKNPSSSVSIAMLISESVYKLVVIIERIIRRVSKTVVPPCRLLFWCLRW
jgi:hypothetical protein